MFHNSEDLISLKCHQWHGVAIGWRKDLDSNVTPVDSLCDRITGFKLKTPWNSVLFACFYAPTSGHDDDFIEALSELTYFLNSNTDTNDQIFIGTDFNVSIKIIDKETICME